MIVSPETRMSGVARWLARIVWLMLMLLLLATFLLALPTFFEDLSNLTYAHQNFGWSVSTMRAALDDIGLSEAGFATILIAVAAPFSLAFFATAIVIFWLRSDDWMALLVSLTLCSIGWSLFTIPQSLLGPFPALEPLLRVLGGISALGLPFVIYLFPNGRFVPGWTRYVATLVIIDGLVILDTSFIDDQTPLTAIIAVLVLLRGITFIAAPIIRYRNFATSTERQQIKWIVAAIILSLLSLVLIFSARPLLAALAGGPSAFTGTGAELLYYLVAGAFASIVFISVPVSITFAMLRYRLWDIDLIIRRTLVYGLVTTVLGAIYVGSITLLQSLVVRFMGTTSALVLVVSTLATVALFAPIRRRVQNVVERHFNRSHYDATRTLEQFGSVARDEVDFEKLETALLAVVDKTMQPRHASLWLNEPSSAGRAARDS